MKPLISVVLPFYGSFDKKRIEVTVNSLQLQENVDLEIILSEQGPQPVLDFKGMNAPNVTHVFSHHEPSNDVSDYSPGQVRNIGIAHSSGEFVYTNDADICFLNPNYLSSLTSLLKEQPEMSLRHPRMKRLPLVEFDNFYEFIQKTDLSSAIKHLHHPSPYIATISGKNVPMKIVDRLKEHGKVFTAPQDLFNSYLAEDTWKGKEPMIFLEDKHIGGNIVRKKHLEEVCGYTHEYLNWGCEDSDLQWKLEEIFTNRVIPQKQEFEVLHLDHPKGYFEESLWRRNEKRFLERKENGIIDALEIDKVSWTAVTNAYSANNS